MPRLWRALPSAFLAVILLAGCSRSGLGAPTSLARSSAASANSGSASATASTENNPSTSITSTAASTTATSSAPAAGSATSLAAATSAVASSVTASAILVAATAGAPGGQTPLTVDAIERVAQQVTPGVVQISNEQAPLGAATDQTVPAGVGTGVVLDRAGHILTNDHVVRGAQKLIVSGAKGAKEYPATLVGADPRTDLAVIQVSNADLPPLELGASSKLQVGQWVVAIGNALGLPGGPTVTVGVVSALGRTLQEPASNGSPATYLFDLIQTSAPINPGNSGGPLVDLAGRVVGINTLGTQANGIGFAIAIDSAKQVAAQLISEGRVAYAYLGVGTTDNTPALAAQYGLPNVPGAAVVTVARNSPAQQAGIVAKDVLTRIGTTAVTSASDVQRALTAAKPGDVVTIQWVQAGTNQQRSTQVTLIER